MSRVFDHADILLPERETDLYKWSVVACDQYTSQPQYWQQVEEIAEDAPSTFNLILPEVYLHEDDVDQRLEKIGETMKEYLKKGIFDEYKDAMIYLERTDSNGMVRQGIVGKIDLEAYDYRKGSTSPVRATESTVLERIPPRIRVREKAEIELPHIMILIDDREKRVIEPMAGRNLKLLYDFDLMQGGGHIKGALMDEDAQKQVLDALEALGNQEHFNGLYGITDKPVLLYAMGDGNHSLATAKAFYEQLKAAHPDEDLSGHPARYALVEIVNLHSPALKFEAIHRIVTNADCSRLMREMTQALGLNVLQGPAPAGSQVVTVVDHGEKIPMLIGHPSSKLTVGSLQAFLDQYVEENGCNIDYIHGEDVIMKLSMNQNCIGFLLPDMTKEDLFPTVIEDGALPRKTFSMGHAQDKRYYMECRRITE